MWISLGWLSGTESGYSLLLILMEASPTVALQLLVTIEVKPQLFAHPTVCKKRLVRQLFSLKENLIFF